ncbi:MAG: hypothetical protein Q7T80_04730 [Methanoregula sp.]|nr:hypothetical protein [Methanoregula sp.]
MEKTMFYRLRAHPSSMRRVYLLSILAALMVCALNPAAGAVTLTLNASENAAHVGDAITFSGTVTGIKTIAVYLFVTGPDLDNRGVTLDNLNIPAGRGLFTTAPVHLENGTWSYTWDTAVILGDLKPGTYTIYVVDSPVDRLRFVKGDFMTTEIVFLPSEQPTNEAPPGPVLPVAALVIAGVLLLGYRGMRRE